MSLVLTQEGAARILQWVLGLADPVVPTCHLLGQDYTPLHTSTLTALATNQVPVGGGYAPIQLTPPAGVWTLSGLVDGGQAETYVLSWTFTVTTNVYGYYVSDDSFGVSLWAELLADPYPYGGGGGVFALQLPLAITSTP